MADKRQTVFLPAEWVKDMREWANENNGTTHGAIQALLKHGAGIVIGAIRSGVNPFREAATTVPDDERLRIVADALEHGDKNTKDMISRVIRDWEPQYRKRLEQEN